LFTIHRLKPLNCLWRFRKDMTGKAVSVALVKSNLLKALFGGKKAGLRL
jgi:hypothetical protein